VPIKDNRLSEGIEIDILHFRCLVAKTMTNELNIHQLPLDFEFFFSDIFADSIKSADIQTGTEGGVAGRGHEPPQFLKIYIYIYKVGKIKI
jgi:hypothetical protein